MKGNLYLVFNLSEWKQNRYFNWSDEDLENATDVGFIGTKFGVDW